MAEIQTAEYEDAQPLGESQEAGASDFIALLKPRVMSLVIFTGAIGLLMAPGSMNPVLAFTAVLLLAIGAGASGALNMWYDADIDAKMVRTISRPIPSGKISKGDALGFGLALSVASVCMMGLMINITSAALLAMTIFFYVVVYTMWLKRRTAQNIVIGGAAGAFPPMIGWAAVTDSVTIESLILFGIIFIWTPAHFWSLSLFISEDYGKAGVPMLPNVSGERETRKQVLIYSGILVPFAVLPSLMGFAGPVYGIVASLFGVVFFWLAINVWRGVDKADRKLFAFSILYLFVVFATMGLERLITEWI